MKVLFSWLKEFVPLEISAPEVADRLSQLGFEIASVQQFGKNITDVVVGDVQDVKKHPNADRLSVCTVNDGTNTYSVVCGASNVRPGIKVPLAKVGAVLPSGLKIQAAKLRGVESQGMICSGAELALEEKSEGIMILSPEAPLGGDIKTILGLDDSLIEIEITPNRRDALSVLGVARELAASLNLPLKNPEPRARELDLPKNAFTVTNETPDLCPRYLARIVRDIKVGPSPEWMVRRLGLCGIRTINNIVDITNYVMLELGQPMHAFDAAKLHGNRLRIRTAHAGESLKTLEGKTAALEPGMLVIADEERPVAIAGVIGGEDSAISEGTKDIVLESAAFDPTSIRKTSKLLGIRTESSYRFERGSDWQMVATASTRAAQLVQELAGGLGYKTLESAPRAYAPTAIKLRTERIRRFLGLDMKESVVADILRRLGGIINMGSGQLLVTVPSWRIDLSTESDLMEELARLYGYENLPARSPTIRLTALPEDPFWSFERRLADVLTGYGLSEAYNFSFNAPTQEEFFTPGFGQNTDAQPVVIANPISQEASLLRTSLLPGLLQNALTNFNRRAPGANLFEFGRVFHRDGSGYHEIRRLGILLAGQVQPPHWRQKSRKADFYELLGILESFLGTLRIPGMETLPAKAAALHPRRAATLVSGNTVLGWMGELHPQLSEKLDTREPLIGAELDLAALMQATPKTVTYEPPSAFPPVLRDLSFVVDEAIPYEKVSKTLRGAGGNLLESLSLIDLYRGNTIGTGKKSMTVSLLFRNRQRTLNDADVEKVMGKIKTDLEKKCEAALRQ